MNGKLAVSIDEEALFEVLATATFAIPARDPARMPAGVVESAAEASPFFQEFHGQRTYAAASAAPSCPF